MPQVIRAPRNHVIFLTVLGGMLTIGLLGIAFAPWVGSSPPMPDRAIGVLFIGSLALLFALFVAWHLSVRAELSETTVTRRSMFGATSLPLSQIDSVRFSSVRGVIFLTVRSSKHWITFSTYTFSKSQLDQIQTFLVMEAAKASKSIQTSLPPWTSTRAINFTIVYLLLIVVAFVGLAIAGVHSAHLRSSFHTTRIN
jgi:hypothetical protein